MFLEKIGKTAFCSLRPLFFYGFIALPLILAGVHLFFERMKLTDLQQNFEESLTKGKLALETKALQDRFLSRHSHVDPHFLDQEIESFHFLQKEQKHIEEALHHPAIGKHEGLKERLSFLLNENRLSFTEHNNHHADNVKETEEKQRHPVQVDEVDLEKLLCVIEDIPTEDLLLHGHRPQLLIQHFHLRRQTTPLATESFSLEMNLLKREFSP